MYDDLLTAPSWWAALSSTERRIGTVTPTPAQRQFAERRLAVWHSGKLLHGAQASADQWYSSGLTEDDLLALLGEQPEDIAKRLPQPPPWLVVISDAWRRFGRPTATGPTHDHHHADHDHHRDHDHHGGHPEPGRDGEHSRPDRRAKLSMLGLAQPLGDWAREELRRRVAMLDPAFAQLPDSHPLFALAAEHVANMMSRVVVLELNIARMEQRLTGDTPQERFASFHAQLRDPAHALAILSMYPVLARELVNHLWRWIETRMEFASRLHADGPLLRETFGLDRCGLADVTELSFGAGDTHHGGRSVAIVTFAGNKTIVYKPRSISVDVHFNDLLRWINERGLRHPLRTLKLVDRGEYGWSEYVPAIGCDDADQVTRYFWRQGVYLAVFYAICGMDLHLENVIAAGEHPVFIDLEVTFQGRPQGLDSHATPLVGAAPMALHNSVIGIGLLPQRIIEVDETGFRDADMSGLAGGGDQLSPSLVPSFTEPGTDEMRMVRKRLPMTATNNRVTVAGGHVDPLHYRNDLLAGFEAGYELIMSNRAALLADDGPIDAFRNDRIRIVLRSTRVYGGILAESMHPDVLHDNLDREFLLRAGLADGHLGVPGGEALLRSELGQLTSGDIPCFHTTASSRDVHDQEGLVAPDFLEYSGIDAVREKITLMSTADLSRQRWCIEASLTGLVTGSPAEVSPPSRRLPDEPIDEDTALRAAAAIGDGLVEIAVTGGTGVAPHWLSLNLLAERFWVVGPAGPGLYDGASGIALFLAHLAGLTGDQRYRRPAEQVGELLADHLRKLATTQASGAELSIGGFGDLGGAVYLLTQLGVLWNAPELLEAATAVAPELTARFAGDKSLDVVYGTAGAALALTVLHEVRPDERLETAIRRAGEVLVDNAVEADGGWAWHAGIDPDQLLTGLSHGASGFALALARIGMVTGDDSWYDGCVRALRFERHHLSAERGNWPDYRSISTDGSYMNAWCHGAAGIGLVRAELATMPALIAGHGVTILDDLRIATERVRADLVPDETYVGVGNHSLCHGDLGLVEALSNSGDVTAARLGRQVARAIADSVLAGEVLPGVPTRVATPGFMTGAAGIGYGLLRAARPDRVPNALTLSGFAR